MKYGFFTLVLFLALFSASSFARTGTGVIVPQALVSGPNLPLVNTIESARLIHETFNPKFPNHSMASLEIRGELVEGDCGKKPSVAIQMVRNCAESLNGSYSDSSYLPVFTLHQRLLSGHVPLETRMCTRQGIYTPFKVRFDLAHNGYDDPLKQPRHWTFSFLEFSKNHGTNGVNVFQIVVTLDPAHGWKLEQGSTTQDFAHPKVVWPSSMDAFGFCPARPTTPTQDEGPELPISPGAGGIPEGPPQVGR